MTIAVPCSKLPPVVMMLRAPQDAVKDLPAVIHTPPADTASIRGRPLAATGPAVQP